MIVRLSASSPPLLFFPKKRKTFTAKQAARADFAAPFFPKKRKNVYNKAGSSRRLRRTLLSKRKTESVYNKAGMAGGGRGIQ